MTVLAPSDTEFLTDFLLAVTFQIQVKNHTDGFSLILIDNVSVTHSVVADNVSVTVEDTVVPADLLSGADAFGNFAAFFLG